MTNLEKAQNIFNSWKIKNFKQDQKINKELFDVALEFAS